MGDENVVEDDTLGADVLLRVVVANVVPPWNEEVSGGKASDECQQSNASNAGNVKNLMLIVR